MPGLFPVKEMWIALEIVLLAYTCLQIAWNIFDYPQLNRNKVNKHTTALVLWQFNFNIFKINQTSLGMLRLALSNGSADHRPISEQFSASQNSRSRLFQALENSYENIVVISRSFWMAVLWK